MSASIKRLSHRATTRSLFDDWTFARGFLLPAAALINVGENELIVKLGGGLLHLWTAPNAAALSMFEEIGSKRVLDFYMAGGDFDEIIAMEPEAMAFGKANGCVRVTWRGREGWQRVAKAHGYKFDYVSMYKDI